MNDEEVFHSFSEIETISKGSINCLTNDQLSPRSISVRAKMSFFSKSLETIATSTSLSAVKLPLRQEPKMTTLSIFSCFCFKNFFIKETISRIHFSEIPRPLEQISYFPFYFVLKNLCAAATPAPTVNLWPISCSTFSRQEIPLSISYSSRHPICDSRTIFPLRSSCPPATVMP